MPTHVNRPIKRARMIVLEPFEAKKETDASSMWFTFDLEILVPIDELSDVIYFVFENSWFFAPRETIITHCKRCQSTSASV